MFEKKSDLLAKNAALRKEIDNLIDEQNILRNKYDEAIAELEEYRSTARKGHSFTVPVGIGEMVYYLPSKFERHCAITSKEPVSLKVTGDIVEKLIVYATSPVVRYFIKLQDNDELLKDYEYQDRWFLSHQFADRALEQKIIKESELTNENR